MRNQIAENNSGDESDKAAAEADKFFADYYSGIEDVPSGGYSEDIQAYRQSKEGGHTLDEDALRPIIKKARARERESRRKTGSSASRRWETWVKGIGFGVYLLAALGFVGHVVLIKRLDPDWQSVRPYVAGILTLGVLLLIADWGRKQLHVSRFVRHALSVLFLLIATLAVVWMGAIVLRDAGILGGQSPETVPVPKELTYVQSERCYGLDEELFGRIDDPGKPLHWMEVMDRGIASRHEMVLWLVCDEFDAAHDDFTAYVHVGTSTSVEILVFLVRLDETVVATPLKRLQGQGPRIENRFAVPETNKGDRLLILLGMARQVYSEIQHNPKFRVTSRPLQPIM